MKRPVFIYCITHYRCRVHDSVAKVLLLHIHSHTQHRIALPTYK